MSKKLTQSSTDRILFGVCGGLAEYFGWDSTWVRLAMVILSLAGVGSPVLVYIILAVIMPRY